MIVAVMMLNMEMILLYHPNPIVINVPMMAHMHERMWKNMAKNIVVIKTIPA